MQLYEHQRRGLAETADKNRVAISGYEGLYSVDKNGNVYSEQTTMSRRKGVLKPEIKNGYLSVNLYKNGKCKHHYVHRLVAAAFIPNPNDYREINHIDCNKHNNAVLNLEWCDRKSNLKHSYDNGLKRAGEKHGCSKLTEKQVAEIRAARGKIQQKQIADKYGVKQCTISAIHHGRIWKEGD